MTYELKLERLLDAPPEVVFDTWVDADTQHDLFAEGGNDGWMLIESSIDLRVGGSWVTTVGKEGRDSDRIARTLTHVDRPDRLAWTEQMYVHDLKLTIATTTRG